MVVLGWALARDSGASRPRRCSGAWTRRPQARRLPDPARAIAAAALFALRVGGSAARDAGRRWRHHRRVFGLAAQQTLGNLIAGMVLISARPFKVGDRVRLQAGGIAGQIEGVVARSACSTRRSGRTASRSWCPTTSC